jgi:protein phosphatase
LFGGTGWYSQHQFYVGSDGTNVVVYKGIEGTVLGIHYSSAIENTGIAVSSLPVFERERVIDTIGASSRRDADRIVGQLHATQAPTATPTPASSAPASPPDSSPAASPPVSSPSQAVAS